MTELVSPVIAERKNGVTSLTASCEQVMNNFIADLQKMNVVGWDAISRDLKVRLRADSSGNWELELLTDWACLLSKTVPSQPLTIP